MSAPISTAFPIRYCQWRWLPSRPRHLSTGSKGAAVVSTNVPDDEVAATAASTPGDLLAPVATTAAPAAASPAVLLPADTGAAPAADAATHDFARRSQPHRWCKRKPSRSRQSSCPRAQRPRRCRQQRRVRRRLSLRRKPPYRRQPPCHRQAASPGRQSRFIQLPGWSSRSFRSHPAPRASSDVGRRLCRSTSSEASTQRLPSRWPSIEFAISNGQRACVPPAH